MFKKINKDNKGFTLTEVMIGIMILTVAVVSASNMLVTLIKSNQVNLTSMQAHYFAQEGLEAVRSIRDTNWLHNQDWLGDNSVLGYQIEDKIGDETGFSLQLNDQGWSSEGNSTLTSAQLSAYFPWEITEDMFIKKCGVAPDDVYFGICGEETIFNRVITIEEYDCEDSSGISLETCESADSILVTSTVSWNIGADSRDLSLSTVLTDWKGGAF